MRQAHTAPMLLACMALLSACNTTDALTPQVDIGDSSLSRRSSPVTQDEVERMAGSEPKQAFAEESRQPAYHSGYNQTYRAGSGAPPTTMQEQADALAQRGESPSASAPIESEALAEPVSNAQAEEEDMGDLAPARQPQQVASIDRTASSSIRGNTVRFLPIIGAPVQAVTPLSRQLGAEARSHGLSIRSSNDTSSDYILKGYLSAFADEGNVTVVYVWDILDGSGARLHRIQGQEKVPSATQDPWAGVPASVMQQIGTKTIAEFNSWRQTHGG
ncbi:hypothetical protein HGP14_14150 [Rhizobium sp. P32RR-XVIII]|uniref:hypothetical protein n=1 Tax=Rhizobium sp. P32RR-XVIII TaxID=2726738 RepID=UPI0014572BB0|nr:hypothetical protein [Rhizobium sp. P32RR-XVIII]NLS04495.1 hypothetical protein [Rhizobium sp. P32RR-XVIII]